MKTAIIQIGNSKGIRIPKPFLKQCQLEDEVELEIIDKKLVVKPCKPVRDGWEERFAKLAQNGDEELVDFPSSQWDEEEWEWK